MKHLRVAAWYWSITVMVVLAMYLAGTPRIAVYVYSYWAMFVAFNAAEAKRQEG